MLRATLFNLVAVALVPALALQLPLVSGHHWKDENAAILSDNDRMEWSLDKSASPNATDHLVFETVHSLLQQWPNTRMRNGHNIVPGIIPAGTLLYHGTGRRELPPGPEWVAMEPEHSYFFCVLMATSPQQDCWHLTLAAARPLKVVYFDGSSAAKFPYGSMDTQDLIAWGESPPGSEWDESHRIEDLCKWGKNFGVDGFVRMSLDFEVMLCDFTSGVRVVSFANLAHPQGVPSVTSGNLVFQVRTAGSWHDRFPGETRVQLDLAGLVSFYDKRLVPSLVAIRAGQERWDHRVRDTSSEDVSAAKSRLEAAVTRPSGLSSGINWKTLVQVIVDRFSGRLELTRYLLNTPAKNPDEIFSLANKTQTQLRNMLTPYIPFSTTPTDPSDEADLDWTIPVYKLCATMHTHFIDSEFDRMTESEKLLLQAVRGTTREICRVVTKMWAAGVYTGIDPSLNTMDSVDIIEVTRTWNTWAEDLNKLMAWLDWSVWVKCDPDCGPEEMCYLPTWPFGFPSPLPSSDASGAQEKLTNLGAWNSIKPGPNEWIRPQPKCIRRVDTYEF